MDAAALVRLHLDECRFRQAESAYVSLRGPSREFAALARLGQRLLRLDLEDIDLSDRPELAEHLPQHLVRSTEPLQFPRKPTGGHRGPLGSIEPLYRLMVEVFEVRWRRRESLHVLALLHLIAEYAGHLVWQSEFGHAGDPLAIVTDVSGSASRWGSLTDEECGHNTRQRHLAEDLADRSSLRSPEAFSDFLRRDYSRVGELLAVCGTRGPMRAFGRRVRTCEAQCSVWGRLRPGVRTDIERRTKLAVLYGRSPLLQLRHSAPIGHFFGVPDLAEIADEWWRMARVVERQLGVDLTPAEEADRVASMPSNVAALCTELAGSVVKPSKLVSSVVTGLHGLVD